MDFASTDIPQDFNTTTDLPLTTSKPLLLLTLLWSTAIIAIIGNVLVIMAFIFDHRKLLKVNFNIYILNLAITDVSVAAVSAPFYAIDVENHGLWIYDKWTCAFWIFVDWGMTFASIFFLVTISIDRYWAACWPNSYRKLNANNKKTFVVVGIVWCCVLVIFIPSFTLDRIRWSSNATCMYSIENNREFSIFMVIFGYHLPSLVMIFCYFKVLVVMRKSGSLFQSKIRPLGTTGPQVASNSNGVPLSVLGSSIKKDSSPQAPCTSSGIGISTAQESGTKTESSTSALVQVLKNTSEQKKKKAKEKQTQEKRIFISLSYILFTYLLTWSPFHIVFDISTIKADLVPDKVYAFAYWMAYVNSMLNPILYAASNKDFRSAIKDVVLLKKCRTAFY